MATRSKIEQEIENKRIEIEKDIKNLNQILKRDLAYLQKGTNKAGGIIAIGLSMVIFASVIYLRRK